MKSPKIYLEPGCPFVFGFVFVLLSVSLNAKFMIPKVKNAN